MEFKIKKIRNYPTGKISWNTNAYLGMSMNNTHFKSENSLNLILEYISQNTNTLGLLVGDYLNHYNFMIFDKLDKQNALKLAYAHSEGLITKFIQTAKKFPIDIKIFKTGSFILDNNFEIKVENFNILYSQHKQFKELIDYSIDLFLRRKDLENTYFTYAKELCKKYLIEELVIFEILAEQGYNLNIYPGNQLPIVKDLVMGKLPKISRTLEQMNIIEIKFKPTF